MSTSNTEEIAWMTTNCSCSVCTLSMIILLAVILTPDETPHVWSVPSCASCSQTAAKVNATNDINISSENI